MKRKGNVIKLNSSLNHAAPDYWILLAVSALLIFGIVMVYSASYYYSIADYGISTYYFYRQIMWVLIGAVVMVLFYVIDYHFWVERFWLIGYAIGLALLVLVMIPGIGTNTFGATRWIYIFGFSLMPGEISKPCLILFLTGYFARYRDYGNKFLRGVVIPGIAAVAYFGLIMLQPNMSTAFTVVFITAGMLIVAGITFMQFAFCGTLCVFAGAFLMFSSEYRRRRYTSFINPFAEGVRLNEGWNAVQSLLAIGTGGIFGKGLGNSVQKNLYLPMGHNDFILAVIGEELGFVGIMGLVSIFVFLFWRGINVALKAKDYEGMMLSFGITFWIAVQVIIHFAVVTSSMPPTGVVLPFISYGGNSMLLFMAGAGMLLNISKYNNQVD
ncbi:MAG: putative lipid II flippase FtsW [Clostridia bacterium]|nr:putative lipid II flippase FtsW [Clostridia bacterium]